MIVSMTEEVKRVTMQLLLLVCATGALGRQVLVQVSQFGTYTPPPRYVCVYVTDD